MATEIIMPRQGQSVESCIITRWYKQVGETVQEGEPLFSYETDKATFEEAAKVSGTLLAVYYQEDDDVPCLSAVAHIGSAGEAAPTAASGTQAASASAAPKEQAVAAKEAANEAAIAAPAQPVPAIIQTTGASTSPRARMVAERLGVDASKALPTGPHGRVIERDVLTLAQSGAVQHAGQAVPVAQPAQVAGNEYEEVKLTGVRRAIAKGMLLSLQNSAQLTNHSSFDATALLALRAQFKAMGEGFPNITLNDMVLFACARVLTRHKDLNAHFVDDKIRRYNHVHLGIAVDTPRGLLVPVLFNADTLSLKDIAQRSKELAKAAQSGSISPDLLTGATFTISNLGALGVEQFTPVINPPQTGILGVCSIVERVRGKMDGLEAYPAMGLSLTYDHRVVDGAPAARFSQDLAGALQNFAGMLV